MTELPGLSRDYLFKLGKQFLAAIQMYWPADAPPLPKRQHVAFGTVFFDREVLAVTFGRSYGVDGDVTSEQWNPQAQLQRRAQIVEVSLMRKVPDLTAGLNVSVPSPEAQETAASAVYGDQVDVWKVCRFAWQQQQLLTVDALGFQDCTPIGPEGGFGGTLTTMRALLL